MKIKGKRILKNGTIAGYVYYQKEKKWKWRIIGRSKSITGGEISIRPNNSNLAYLYNILKHNNIELPLQNHQIIYKDSPNILLYHMTSESAVKNILEHGVNQTFFMNYVQYDSREKEYDSSSICLEKTSWANVCIVINQQKLVKIIKQYRKKKGLLSLDELNKIYSGKKYKAFERRTLTYNDKLSYPFLSIYNGLIKKNNSKMKRIMYNGRTTHGIEILLEVGYDSEPIDIRKSIECIFYRHDPYNKDINYLYGNILENISYKSEINKYRNILKQKNYSTTLQQINIKTSKIYGIDYEYIINNKKYLKELFDIIGDSNLYQYLNSENFMLAINENLEHNTNINYNKLKNKINEICYPNIIYKNNNYLIMIIIILITYLKFQ